MHGNGKRELTVSSWDEMAGPQGQRDRGAVDGNTPRRTNVSPGSGPMPYQPVPGQTQGDDPKKKKLRIQGVQVLGAGHDLAAVVEKSAAEMIFIAIPSATGEQVTEILNRCSGLNERYKIIPPIGEMIESNPAIPRFAPVIRIVSIEHLKAAQISV